MPVELTNFTVWGRGWFEDGWEGLRGFCVRHEIRGIELLAAGANVDTAPPSDLIFGVHLRSMGSWLPLAGVDVEGFGVGAARYAAAETYGELVRTRAAELAQVAELGPEYAVWHGSYAPFPQVLDGSAQLTHMEHLEVLARLTHDVLAEYEPPFRVCFENSFGVGLSLDEPDMVRWFVERLAGLPVGIAADIGHHLNTRRDIASPDEACRELSRVAGNLRERGVRLDVLHLHWTPPSLVPPDIEDETRRRCLSLERADERAAAASALYEQADQHRPLASDLLAEAVADAAPEWVVHELGAMTLEDHAAWLSLQAASMRRGM